MTKKLHPADIADRAAIARAVSFNVHMRFGPADKVNEPATTLAEAVAIAARLDAANPTRRSLIYAVTPEGTSHHVPEDLKAAAKESTMSNLTGTQISQLTAIITGGGYKRANSKEAAEKRFLKIAAEAGLTAAPEVLTLDFDAATAELTALVGKIAPAEKAEPAPVTTEQPAKAPTEKKAGGKRAAILEAAQRGELPAAPDFSAATHTRFRGKLADLVALAEKGDIAALKAFPINPISSSPKAMDRYRNLAVIALEARAAKKDAA